MPYVPAGEDLVFGRGGPEDPVTDTELRIDAMTDAMTDAALIVGRSGAPRLATDVVPALPLWGPGARTS